MTEPIDAPAPDHRARHDRPAWNAYLDHLARETARAHTVLADLDPATPVPSCPDWSAADLLWHLAEVQQAWAQIVRERPASPDVLPEGARRPTEHPDLLAHARACASDLVRTLRGSEPSDPAWTWAGWSPDGATVGFAYRRQTHEALIHRVDAELAAGARAQDVVLEADLAADGVAECLEVMLGGQPDGAGLVPVGTPLVLDLTDVGVRIGVQPGQLSGHDRLTGRELSGPHLLVVPAPDAPAAVVSGTAAHLDLWLWGRLPRDTPLVRRRGSAASLEAFDAATTFPID